MDYPRIPVSRLALHPVLANVPSLSDDHPDFVRLLESIREEGCLDPVKVTPSFQLVDGRHRARAAVLLDPDASLPYVTIPEDRAAEVALDSLIARRHLATKGQLAYVSFPLVQPAYQAMAERHSQRLRAGIRGSGPVDGIDSLCAQMGIARALFFHAARIHDLFAHDPALRTEWEPKILDSDEPVGLGSVISGIAGAAATKGTARPPTRNTSLSRWHVSWGELGKHSLAWDRWSAEERDQAAQRVRDSVAAMPDPLLDVLRDSLKAARRARNRGEETES